MHKKPLQWFLLTGCCFLISNCSWKTTMPPPIVIHDLLSFSTNTPGYYWQVGYSDSNLLSAAQFHFCTYAETDLPIAIWHPANNIAYPYTGQNRDTVAHLHSSGQWALRPHQVAMEGSNTGQYSMLRFVAPAKGNYKIKVVFEGIHFGLSSTDVHVLFNNTPLFNDLIEGYGGDSSFHAITGAHPSSTYNGLLLLEKGDAIVFVVGYGANKTHYNDTTGLTITIEMI